MDMQTTSAVDLDASKTEKKKKLDSSLGLLGDDFNRLRMEKEVQMTRTSLIKDVTVVMRTK